MKRLVTAIIVYAIMAFALILVLKDFTIMDGFSNYLLTSTLNICLPIESLVVIPAA